MPTEPSGYNKRRELEHKFLTRSEKEAIFAAAPPSAQNLLDMAVFACQKMGWLPDDDHKVNPSRYESIKECDLGLCYETFFTTKSCRYGQDCPWRHSELVQVERDFLEKLRATDVLRSMDKWRCYPEVPERTGWYWSHIPL